MTLKTFGVMENEQNMQKNKGVEEQKDARKKRPNRNWRWVYYIFMGLLLLSLFWPKDGKNVQKDLSYTKFMSYIERGMVSELTIYDDNRAEAKIRPENYTVVFGSSQTGEDAKGSLVAAIPSVDSFTGSVNAVNEQRKSEGKMLIDVKYEKSRDIWYLLLINVVPWIVLILFFVWMSRGMGRASA